jgi:hypothetical protein
MEMNHHIATISAELGGKGREPGGHAAYGVRDPKGGEDDSRNVTSGSSVATI